jgi:hypothetical protein
LDWVLDATTWFIDHLTTPAGKAAAEIVSYAAIVTMLAKALEWILRKKGEDARLSWLYTSWFVALGVILGTVTTLFGGIPYIWTDTQTFPGWSFTAGQVDSAPWQVKAIRTGIFGGAVGGVLVIAFTQVIRYTAKKSRVRSFGHGVRLFVAFVTIGGAAVAIGSSMSEIGDRMAKGYASVPLIGAASLDEARKVVWFGSGICANLYVYEVEYGDQKTPENGNNNACDVGAMPWYTVLLSIFFYNFAWIAIFWLIARWRGDTNEARLLAAKQSHLWLALLAVFACGTLSLMIPMNSAGLASFRQAWMEDPIHMLVYLASAVVIAGFGFIQLRGSMERYLLAATGESDQDGTTRNTS